MTYDVVTSVTPFQFTLMSISRHFSRASVVARSRGMSTYGHFRPWIVSGTRLSSTAPAYGGHIPLNWFENAFLAVGSAVMSLADPRRGGELINRGFT